MTDICAIDFPERKNRFEVAYNFLSLQNNKRLILKVCINETSSLNSIVSAFKTAKWLEREIWDMFGIQFVNHKDLRRILTDYGFSGHPLKKDFPLTGFFEVRFNENQKRVIYEPVELNQEFRFFNVNKPW